MSDAELRETLAELHGQLEEAEPLDAGLREELRRAVADIQAHLGSGADATSEEAAGGGSLASRLSEIVERFEGNHPRIAESVNRVILGLAELGI